MVVEHDFHRLPIIFTTPCINALIIFCRNTNLCKVQPGPPFDRFQGEDDERIATLGPIAAAPFLDNSGIGHKLNVDTGDIPVVRRECAAGLLAHARRCSGEPGVLARIHECLIDIMNGCLECHFLLDVICFHSQ